MVGGDINFKEVDQEIACKNFLENLNSIIVQETSAKTLLLEMDLHKEKESFKFLNDNYLEQIFKRIHTYAINTCAQEEENLNYLKEFSNLERLERENADFIN